MSIIHDALKKVQQGLASKTEDIEVIPPATKPNTSAYIYDTPAPAGVETLPESPLEVIAPKAPIQNKIKSALALICALVITAGSTLFIYQQFRNYIPMAQRMAKKSINQLMHKEEIPDFKTQTPSELKPLMKLTVNPPVSSPASTIKPPAPTTLSVHGIMSGSTGNLVLIDDQVYQEGDEVDGAKIIKIDLDSITVILNGQEQKIRVKS